MMRIIFLLLALLPSLTMANAGQILYVNGQVAVERNGKLYRAVKNAKLLQGDTIKTGHLGRMHVRMADRTLLSLKPDTQFKIEVFRYARATPQAQKTNRAGSRQVADDVGDRSLFLLVKGGLRVITGLIGQRDKSAFGISTPVATIGIRGTSFVAQLSGGPDEFAALDPVLQPQKLTVGVGDGGVILTSPQGSLLLENGEFGEIISGGAPQRLLLPVADEESDAGVQQDADTASEQDEDTQTQVATRTITTQTGLPTGGSADHTPPEGKQDLVSVPTEFITRRSVALVSNVVARSDNGETQVLTLSEAATRLDAQNNVTSLIGGIDKEGNTTVAVIGLIAGQVQNQGVAPDLGIQWGRWSGGHIDVTTADGNTQSFETANANLHLIQSGITNEAPVIPRTGSRDFVLVGNTDPTNSNGATGFLGQATLAANFDNQTVNSSLSLSIEQQVWQANGTAALGSAANAPDHVFSGAYSTVSIGTGTGQGEFSGFLTDQAAGAGLSYQLSNQTTSVHGVAAFAAN